MRKSLVVFAVLFFVMQMKSELIAQQPLFPNSVVSNDIDFIQEADPDSFIDLVFLGLEDKEMPDSQSDILFDENTFVFEAYFSTGPNIEIWCHSSFLTVEAAQEYAEKLCPRLGKLPEIHRLPLDHVVIHKGNAGAFAEIEGNFFILYSENMDIRISNNDLEETVFHEAVHASIQFEYADNEQWMNAQESDPAFVTEYAESLPDLEDFPETALFAYTYFTHPGRLSSEIEEWLIENIPSRLEFFCSIIYGNCEVNVSESFNEFSVEPYPNPTSGNIMVEVNQIEEGSYINMFNSSGKVVLSIKAQQGSNILELTNLSEGIYFLNIRGYPIRKVQIVNPN